MRPRLRWLRWILPALLALAVALYGTASWYMAYQVTLAERKAPEAAPGDFGLSFEEVSFAPRGGDISLKGWYISAGKGQATIIVSHGINSNRADTGIGLLEIARDLGQRGFNVLLFDLRGHGESGGTQVSGGYFERLDVLGAFDFLLGRGVPADKIGVMGFSMGGAIVLLAAGEEPRIQAVAADSAFADVADLIVEETKKRTDAPDWLVPALVPGMTTAARLVYGINMKALAPIRVVARLDYPVLLIHGTADTRISPSHAERMKQASPYQETELWLVEGAEHVKAYRTSPQEYIERVAGYYEERLSIKPST